MRTTAVLLSCIVLAGCARQELDYRAPRAGEAVAPFTVRLDPEALDDAHARADARRALYRGDKALLAGDPAAAVPGVPGGWKEENWRFGVREVEDAFGDARDPAHAAFQRRALRYAATYNRRILEEVTDWPYRRRTFNPVARALTEPDDVAARNNCRAHAHFRMEGLNQRYAAASAREQHAAGQPVLIGVWGYSVGFPGASSEDAERLGCVIIAGTSDNQMGDGGFSAAAMNYAHAWNVEMLRLTAAKPATG